MANRFTTNRDQNSKREYFLPPPSFSSSAPPHRHPSNILLVDDPSPIAKGNHTLHRVESDSGSGSRHGEQRYGREERSPSSVIYNTTTPMRPTDGGGGGNAGYGEGSNMTSKRGLDDGNDRNDEPAGNGKRKKKAVSCEACRRRKLKCDRGWPCGACRDRNEAHLCKWEGGTRPQAPGRDQDGAPMLVRMDRIESLLSAIATHVGLSPEGQTIHSNTIAATPALEPSAISNGQGSKKDKRAIATEAKTGRNDPANRGVLVSGWQPITVEEARRELGYAFELLPEPEMVRKMCKYFVAEVHHMHYGKLPVFGQNTAKMHHF
jgi:hypothetical protein